MRLRPALAGVLGFVCLLAVTGTPEPAALVARLGDRTAKDRDAAAARLREIGAEAAPALEAGAKSRDPAVRSRSAALLAIVRGDPDGSVRARLASAAVRDALLAEGGLVAGSALDARIAALMPESGRALVAAADCAHAGELVSSRLVSALARHAAEETLASLAALVRDERVAPSAALEAARALDREFDESPARAAAVRGEAPHALAILEEAMASRHAPTRRAAVAVYGALAGADGALRVVDAADDADESVRAECARVLGVHAPGTAGAALRRLAADPAAPVREAALTALLAIPGSPRAEPAVAAADDASPAVRAAAARLLAREATPDTVGCLETLAADPSLRVRAAARRALASLR